MVIAMQIFNMSIDIDHAVQYNATPGISAVDDIDSFAEFLIEGITGNDSLFHEAHGEDRHTHHKLTIKSLNICDVFRESQPLLKAQATPVLIQSDPNRNSRFTSNDYSTVFSPPPDRC
jgi:hypothetical protein